MGPALLLVDIQNDYFPGGRMELEGAEAAALQAAALLSHFRDAGRPVIHVQHVSNRPGATFFLPDTPGVEIHQAVRPRAGETSVIKHFPNSFRGTPLADLLRSRDIGELTVAGMMTHMCIDTTVRAAFDLGLRCTLAHDACATRSLAFGAETIPAREVHRSFIAALHGLFAQARTAGEILAAG